MTDDFDFDRYEELVTQIFRHCCEQEEDADYLEIGANISTMPEIKIIFDGFGLAEEFYHDGFSYRLEDDEIQVLGEDWQWRPLDTENSEAIDLDYIREKLELYQQYADDDGPKNPDLRSYAIFIHRNSGDVAFEFPEHEFTPWGLIHRPSEEVCIYVWHDLETDSLEINEFIEPHDGLSSAEVMEILEQISENQQLDQAAQHDSGIYSQSWQFQTNKS